MTLIVPPTGETPDPEVPSLRDYSVFTDLLQNPKTIEFEIAGEKRSYKMTKFEKLDEGGYGITCLIEAEGGETIETREIKFVFKLPKSDTFLGNFVIELEALVELSELISVPDPVFAAISSEEEIPLTSITLVFEDPNTGSDIQVEDSGIAMEFIDGDAYVTYSTIFERRNRGETLLDFLSNEAIQISRCMEDAVERGICHLDLKPENIRFRQTGQAVVLDWGLIAIIKDGRIKRKTFKFNNLMFGTEKYIYPEIYQTAMSPSVGQAQQPFDIRRGDAGMYERASLWSAYNLVFHDMFRLFPYYLDNSRSQIVADGLLERQKFDLGVYMRSQEEADADSGKTVDFDMFLERLTENTTLSDYNGTREVRAVVDLTNWRELADERSKRTQIGIATFAFLTYHMDNLVDGVTPITPEQVEGESEAHDFYRRALDSASRIDSTKPSEVMIALSEFIDSEILA